MVKEEKLLEVADFNLLWVLQNPSELLENARVNGWRCLAQKRGLMDSNFEPLEKGLELLELFKTKEEHVSIFKEVEEEINLDVWAENLEGKLRDVMLQADKKANHKGFGGVTFLPTNVEIMKHLKVFWREYKNCKDLDRIEKILLEHVRHCIATNNFAPACKYFIYKSGHGTHLGGAYKNFKEEDAVTTIGKKEELF